MFKPTIPWRDFSRDDFHSLTENYLAARDIISEGRNPFPAALSRNCRISPGASARVPSAPRRDREVAQVPSALARLPPLEILERGTHHRNGASAGLP